MNTEPTYNESHISHNSFKAAIDENLHKFMVTYPEWFAVDPRFGVPLIQYYEFSIDYILAMQSAISLYQKARAISNFHLMEMYFDVITGIDFMIYNYTNCDEYLSPDLIYSDPIVFTYICQLNDVRLIDFAIDALYRKKIVINDQFTGDNNIQLMYKHHIYELLQRVLNNTNDNFMNVDYFMHRYDLTPFIHIVNNYSDEATLDMFANMRIE